jgi:hypothetical protein
MVCGARGDLGFNKPEINSGGTFVDEIKPIPGAAARGSETRKPAISAIFAS